MRRRIVGIIVATSLIALLIALIAGAGVTAVATKEDISGEKIVQDANYLQGVISASNTYLGPDKEKLRSIEPAMSELDQRLGGLKKIRKNLQDASAILDGYVESKTGLKSEEMTGDIKAKISAGLFSTSQEMEGSIKQEKLPERIWGNFTIYYEDSEINRLEESIPPLISGAEVGLPGREATEVIFANIIEKKEVSVLDILALDSAVNQWKNETESVIAKIEETKDRYALMVEKMKHPFLQGEFVGVELAGGLISLVAAIIIGYLVFYRTEDEDKGFIAGVITFFVALAALTAGVIAVIML